MTLHARGYRPHVHGLDARGPRFLPILVQGYRDAVRGRAFRWLTTVFVVFLVVYCALLYVTPDLFLRRLRGGAGPGEMLRLVADRYLLSVSAFVPLLALFVGAGLVAEDLRTRALPLYLVRPLTPADYWLGKLLIPVAVLATSYVAPLVFLVLFGVLLQPSAEILGFAVAQADLLGAVLAHGALACLAYASLVLLVSTVAGSRLGAFLLGAAVVYGSEMLRIAMGGEGPAGDRVWRAIALPTDLRVVFEEAADVPFRTGGPEPGLGAALAAIAILVAAGAAVVLRRARSAEVTS